MFAGLRFAVVMMRIGKMVIDFELAPPESDTGVNNLVTVLLATMLGMPSAELRPTPASHASARAATSARGARRS